MYRDLLDRLGFASCLCGTKHSGALQRKKEEEEGGGEGEGRREIERKEESSYGVQAWSSQSQCCCAGSFFYFFFTFFFLGVLFYNVSSLISFCHCEIQVLSVELPACVFFSSFEVGSSVHQSLHFSTRIYELRECLKT